MIGTLSIPGLLDGDHHNGPVNICDAGVHVRDYKQKAMKMYEPPAPLLKVGTAPFNGHNQRGMPVERPSIGEVASVPRLMKDTDVESGVSIQPKKCALSQVSHCQVDLGHCLRAITETLARSDGTHR